MWKLKNCLVKPVITNTANIIIMFLLFYKKDVKYVTYINLLDLLLFACMCPVMSDGLFLTPRPSLPGSSVHGISQARIWSGLPFPSPGDLPTQGSNPGLLHWQADSLPPSHQERWIPETQINRDLIKKKVQLSLNRRSAVQGWSAGSAPWGHPGT